MIRLALASLRLRKGSAVGAFLALLFAAAIVCACGTLLETGIRGTVVTERYSGTPVVVSADQQVHWTKHKHHKTKVKSKPLAERAWLAGEVGARLRALPHVEVVPDLSFPADLADGGRVLPGPDGAPSSGHGWSSAALTPYRLTSGRPPRSDRDVVLDARLARSAGLGVGDRVTIQASAAPTGYRVVGVAAPRATVSHQSALFFADQEARRLAGRGDSVVAYGVFGADPGVVRRAVGTTGVVSTGSARADVEFPDASRARATLVSLGGAVGGTSLIVAVLVVVGTFALSIQQRHRELALLRAVGATPRQVRRMLRAEALALGVLAGIPGAVLGIGLAGVIRGRFVELGALPSTVALVHSPVPVVGAVLATTLTGVLAAVLSARRIARIRPAEALSLASAEPAGIGAVRMILGVTVALAALAVTLLLTTLHTEPAATPVTYLGALLWLTGFALLGPILAGAATTVAGPVLRAGAAPAFLAAKNARAHTRRIASVATPMALMVGLLMTILFVPATLANAAATESEGGIRAAYVVDSEGPGVPEEAVRRLRAEPGVSTVVRSDASTIWIGRTKRRAQGLTTPGLGRVLDPGVTSGSLSRLGPGTVAMSSLAAGGRRLGDRVRVTLGDGTTTRLRLVAVFGRRLAFGDVLMSYDELAPHVDSPLAQTALVDGTTSAGRLRAALAGYPGLRVSDRSAYERAQGDRRQHDDRADLELLALIIGFTAIAVVNTQAMATVARARELAQIRLVGATPRQARTMLRWELALIVLLATVIGTSAAWATLTGFSVGMTGHGSPTGRLATSVLVLLGAAGLGVVATSVPARSLLRRDPAYDAARKD